MPVRGRCDRPDRRRFHRRAARGPRIDRRGPPTRYVGAARQHPRDPRAAPRRHRRGPPGRDRADRRPLPRRTRPALRAADRRRLHRRRSRRPAQRRHLLPRGRPPHPRLPRVRRPTPLPSTGSTTSPAWLWISSSRAGPTSPGDWCSATATPSPRPLPTRSCTTTSPTARSCAPRSTASGICRAVRRPRTTRRATPRSPNSTSIARAAAWSSSAVCRPRASPPSRRDWPRRRRELISSDHVRRHLFAADRTATPDPGYRSGRYSPDSTAASTTRCSTGPESCSPGAAPWSSTRPGPIGNTDCAPPRRPWRCVPTWCNSSAQRPPS